MESVPVETERWLDDPAIPQCGPTWLELIQSCKRQLDLEFFYLRQPEGQGGEALSQVIQAIENCPHRQVRVRVLVDKGFLKTYPELAQRWGGMPGFEVRTIDLKTLAGGVQHAKLMVVDQEQVFLGSQNFDWTSLEHIRELGLRLRGQQLCQAYQGVFEADWRRAGGESVTPPTSPYPEIELPGGLRVKPVTSPRHWDPCNSEEQALLDLMAGARQTIQVQVMTYSPVVGYQAQPGYYSVLDEQLRAAATRGVKVQLLVSDWGVKSPHREHLLSLAQIPGLEVRVSRIPAWSGGDIPFARVGHSKYLVVDGDRGWVGTSNWEKTYFHNSRDVGLQFTGARLGQPLQQFFLRDWNGPSTSPLVTP